MAQTKRRRQTKHRGNAAGMIESRGRTGRKPTDAEKRPEKAASGREKRPDRRDQPPTWRGAFYRSLVAAAIMLALAIVLTHRVLSSLVLFPIVLIFYVPLSYYSDGWFYRRRMRSKSRPKAARK